MQEAAFTATYSEWKVVKTRAVVQVVFEVPVENSDAAYQVLGGMPISGRERWFAIAALDKDAAASAIAALNKDAAATYAATRIGAGAKTPGRRRRSNPYAREIAMACNDSDFLKFLCATYDPVVGTYWGSAAERAANIVRKELGVKSRADVLPGTNAANAWRKMYDRFFEWLDERVKAGLSNNAKAGLSNNEVPSTNEG
jgi:hypothetical protein